MSEICKKKFGLFFHFFFFFFLLSHPFYFSYFLNLLSFLSPLFISTFLLCFAFSSLFLSSSSHLHSVPQCSDDSKMGFLASTLRVVFDGLRPRTRDEIDEFRSVEELEAYKMVFESCNFGSEQYPCGGEDSEFIVPEVEVNVVCEESVENFPGKILDVEVDCKESMENFPEKILGMKVDCEESREYFAGKIWDMRVECEDFMENFPGKILDKGVDCKQSMENFPEKMLETKPASEKSVEYFPGKILDVEVNYEEPMIAKIVYEEHLENSLLNENNAEIEAKTEEHKEAKIEKIEETKDSWKAIENKRKKIKESWISSRSESSPCNLLFEDRRNSEETEGMDLLWEAYEKMESKKLQKINRSSKRGKIIEDEDEDENENGNGEGKLCCLQALKLSARKMNLGMGKRNLVKMSKALKGFGLFRKRSLIH